MAAVAGMAAVAAATAKTGKTEHQAYCRSHSMYWARPPSSLRGGGTPEQLDGMHDARPTVACDPHAIRLDGGVQVAAAAMLLEEGVEGGEERGHVRSSRVARVVPSASAE